MPVKARSQKSCVYVWTQPVAKQGIYTATHISEGVKLKLCGSAGNLPTSPMKTTNEKSLIRLLTSVKYPTIRETGAPNRKKAEAISPPTWAVCCHFATGTNRSHGQTTTARTAAIPSFLSRSSSLNWKNSAMSVRFGAIKFCQVDPSR